MRVDTERRLLPGTIGYMSLSIWLDPARVFKFWQASMAEFASADGIIIDLRGNPGGLGAMSMGIGGFYVADRNVKLGKMIMRTGEMRFVLNPQPRPYAGPVAILVDELSMSTSEIFAGGMRDIGRAKIFGTKTPGAALPSAIEKLPNGDGFQYAYANYLSASGIALEGNGVTPDESTPLTRAALLAGKDPALDAAVEWIASKPSPMLPKKSPTASAGASN
jgi:carboxyl-terminal processing protease